MRLLLVVFFAWCYGAAAPLAVHLHSTLTSPQPVGVSIGLSPRVENPARAMHVFRYSVSVGGGPFRVVRDFSQQPDFIWAPELYEHAATVRVTVRNNESKATAEDDLRFQIVSRIKGKAPVVTPSAASFDRSLQCAGVSGGRYFPRRFPR